MIDFYNAVLGYAGMLETDDVLIRAGIDPEALEYMTGAERKEILKRAGLNLGEIDHSEQDVNEMLVVCGGLVEVFRQMCDSMRCSGV